MSIKISVVIPTFREAGNIAFIAKRIADTLSAVSWPYEIIFVDDDSDDGTEQQCQALAASLPVRMIVRKNEKGLATAVLRGIEEAKGDYVVVMDADLSHPPEQIPNMVDLLTSDTNDFVVGSRYVAGGSLDDSWGWWRRLNSWSATVLALPLCKIHDPMSGYFAFRRNTLPDRQLLSPLGYKIGLELLVKGAYNRPGEVPIHFADRRHDSSKLNWQQQISYLRHLRRLYQHRFPLSSQILQFSFVGATGFIVDLLIYLGLQWAFGIHHRLARALSFWGAASSNWALNRILTFSNRQRTAKLPQWRNFVLTSLAGFAVNFGSYYFLTSTVPFFQEKNLILAFIIGVLLGFGLNFIAARQFVFKPYQQEVQDQDGYTKNDIGG